MLLATILAFSLAAPANLPGDVRVSTGAELRTALAAAKPGTRILVAAGPYDGFHASDLRGSAEQPIVIVAAVPEDPPVFRGGVHLSDAVHVELAHLSIAGAPANGLNIDDGGSFESPSSFVVLRGLTVRDCGGKGNEDGIKLSGVVDFRVEDCTIERWGRGGS